MHFSAQEIEAIQNWVRAAGQVALDHQDRFKMHIKEDRTPVTDVEVRMETLLIENIRRAYPGAPVISEEHGVQPGRGDITFIIDPIDGTKSYLRGTPGWGVALAVFHQGQPAAGFFYMPAVQDFYWGSDEGAFWNDRPLPPLPAMPYDDPLTFLAVPSSMHMRYEIRYPRIQALGSTMTHLMYVARGSAMGEICRRVYIYDMAAAMPILAHAGIAMEYLSGKSLDLPFLLAGNKTPEPVISTRKEWLQRLRADIVRRPSETGPAQAARKE